MFDFAQIGKEKLQSFKNKKSQKNENGKQMQKDGQGEASVDEPDVETDRMGVPIQVFSKPNLDHSLSSSGSENCDSNELVLDGLVEVVEDTDTDSEDSMVAEEEEEEE